MEDEGIKEIGEQPNTTLQQLYGQKKAVRRAVDKAKREMEEELTHEDCEGCKRGMRTARDVREG